MHAFLPMLQAAAGYTKEYTGAWAMFGAGLGAGPRDGLMTGIAGRTGWPIKIVRTAIELSVLAAGWLMRHGLPRVVLIVGATAAMALCAAGIFVDGVPDLLRLVLAGVYSAVIGVVPAALFTALPVHTPRPELVGASTGLLMQGSNIGGLLGPPITGALVVAGGWPAAAWLTSVALGIAAAAGLFLHWRERRRLGA